MGTYLWIEELLQTFLQERKPLTNLLIIQHQISPD